MNEDTEEQLFQKLRKPDIRYMMKIIMKKYPWAFLNTSTSWRSVNDKNEFLRSYGWTNRELIDKCMELPPDSKEYIYGFRNF